MEKIKNFRAWHEIRNFNKNGEKIRRPRTWVNLQTTLDSGLMVEVQPTDEDFKYMGFSDEQSKIDFVSGHIWLEPTEMGQACFYLWQISNAKSWEIKKSYKQGVIDATNAVTDNLRQTIFSTLEIQED